MLEKGKIMKSKFMFSLVLVLLIILMTVLSYFDDYDFNRQGIITIGTFSGSYWNVQNGNSYKLLDNAIEKFEKQNPNIKVEYVSGITKEDYSDWLYSRLLEGNAPDVFFVLGEDFNTLSELGAMRDLSKLIERDKKFNTDDYYEASYCCGRYKNTQYALPYESAVDLMFVNKTILADEEIDVPKVNWTWEDFYNICKAVTKDKNGDGIVDRFGVCNYTWEEAMVSNGVNIFDENGTVINLNSNSSVEAVSFIEKLENLNNGYTVTSNDFDLGNVVFQPLDFSQYRAYKPYPLRVKKYSSFEWDCITMPAGPNGKNTSYMDTLLLAVNNNTHNEKYAWEFMKTLSYDKEIQSQIFMYSEGASPLKGITNSKEIIDFLERDGNIKMSLLDYAMRNATVVPSFRDYNNAVKMVNSEIRDTLEGNSNISMSLIKKQRDINKYLKKEN